MYGPLPRMRQVTFTLLRLAAVSITLIAKPVASIITVTNTMYPPVLPTIWSMRCWSIQSNKFGWAPILVVCCAWIHKLGNSWLIGMIRAMLWGISSNFVRVLAEDKDGQLWVGTNAGLNRMDVTTGQFKHYRHDTADPYSLSNDDVRSLLIDSKGGLWIGTDGGGLNAYDARRDRFIRYRNEAVNSTSLSNDYVMSLYEDTKGGLWMGTNGGGVNKVNVVQRQFGHIKHHPQIPDSLNSSEVYAIHKDSRGSLWVGTTEGLNRQLPGQSGFSVVTHHPQQSESTDLLIQTITEDDEGNLWYGSDDGLYRYRLDDDQITLFSHDPDDVHSLGSNLVRTLFYDKDGVIWVGCRGGLNRFDSRNHQFIHYRHDAQAEDSLSDDTVRAVLRDSRGDLWVGTWNGLNRLDEETGRFTRFLHDKDNPDSISSNKILALLEDHQGALWIATYGGGLNKYHPQTGKFSHYTTKEGLANDSVYAVLSDNNNDLWVSTNRGISRFNIGSSEFKTWDVHDGLQSDEFNSGAYFSSSDGELFFGGINGLNRFYGESIVTDNSVPKVEFTEFLLFNNPVLARQAVSGPGEPFVMEQAIDRLERMTLGYRQNLVSFEFAALDHTNPLKTRYAYKLAGYNEDWIYTDAKNRRATFTNLPQGNYTLQVRASNADGLWSQTSASIALTVEPPPWKTWWAITLYVLLVLLIIWYYVRGERKKVEQERAVVARLQQLDKLKDEFLANTSHELRTPLNGIIGLAESLIDGATGPLSEQTKANLAMVVSSGKRLANLVNDIMDFSKLKNRHLDIQLRPVDLRGLADIVLALSRHLIGEKSLVLVNDMPGDLPAVQADDQRLQQILLNLVGNAIKFTEQGSGDFVCRGYR